MKKKTSNKKLNIMDASYQEIYKNAEPWGKEAINDFMKNLRAQLRKEYEQGIQIKQVDPAERKSSKARDDEYGAS